MHPDFQAFTSHTVLESFQKKIEVVEGWDEKIIAGLSDGSLVILQPDEENDSRPWQVIKALKQFSKKSVLQMQVRQHIIFFKKSVTCMASYLAARRTSFSQSTEDKLESLSHTMTCLSNVSRTRYSALMASRSTTLQ